MTSAAPESLQEPLRRLAGYLNFSSGPADAATLAAMGTVYSIASDGDPLSGMPAWLIVRSWIANTLAELKRQTKRSRIPPKLIECSIWFGAKNCCRPIWIFTVTCCFISNPN